MFRSIRVREDIAILVNIGCMNFVIYLFFDMWTSYLARIFFFYNDLRAGFENFLVLEGYLMGNNIVSMCDVNSILTKNPYGV